MKHNQSGRSDRVRWQLSLTVRLAAAAMVVAMTFLPSLATPAGAESAPESAVESRKPPVDGHASSGFPGRSRIKGVVRDARVVSTKLVYPDGYKTVGRATVTVSGRSEVVVTDVHGAFALDLASGGSPYATVDIVVTAPGFGRWTYVAFPLRTGVTNNLDVDLKSAPQTISVPTAEQTIAAGNGPSASAAAAQSVTAATAPMIAQSSTSCSGFFSNSTPPSTIKVYRQSGGYVQAYDFNFYVKHVLPSEWIPSWPSESLKAGAMAAKEYAWYWTNNWRGGQFNGTCYDVDDTTNYQVFNPAYSTSSTDVAVDATWTDLALRAGAIFSANYNAGTPTCSRINGWQMYQWGSWQCAQIGYGYRQILTTFYDGLSFARALPVYQAAFQANTGNLWTYSSAGSVNDKGQGMMAGTSPSITALSGGGYEAAFQANTSALIVFGDGGNINTGLGMMAGTSPSIAALPSGGFVVAFQANTGFLYLYSSSTGGINTGLGMSAGTSPSLAASPFGGFQVAFQANTGTLWTYSSAGSANDKGQGMRAGTSPSIAALSSGGYEAAFQANTSALIVFGDGGNINTGLGMMAGTSPSIAASPGGGFAVASQANTGNLYTYLSTIGAADTGQGMRAGTSPSITALSSGGYEEAFQANTSALIVFGDGGNLNTGLGMRAGTSPTIA